LFDDQKRRFPLGGDDGSSFFSVYKLISGMPRYARGDINARGKLKPRRDVTDLKEDDDPVGFGAAVCLKTVRFGGGGRPTL
jgi:hypothetical protein